MKKYPTRTKKKSQTMEIVNDTFKPTLVKNKDIMNLLSSFLYMDAKFWHWEKRIKKTDVNRDKFFFRRTAENTLFDLKKLEDLNVETFYEEIRRNRIVYGM
jgi:hypothetical protein